MAHDRCKGRVTIGRAEISIPRIPSPNSKSPKKLDLHGPPANGAAKFGGEKYYRNNNVCCSENGIAGARGWIFFVEGFFVILPNS